MIIKFNENILYELTGFILKNNVGKKLVRYLPQNKELITEKINKRTTQDDVELLVNVKNNRITGYMELLVDYSDKYLQILAHLSDENYTKSLDCYFEYIRRLYSGFKMHYVLGNHNIEAIKYMNNTKATTDGFETMMHIDAKDNRFEKSNNIIMFNAIYNEQFTAMHNENFQEVYWTAELILEQKKFDILLYVIDSQVWGYSVTSHFGNTEEEIYFIYGLTNEIKYELYKESLNNAFKYTDSVQVLLDPEEEMEILQLKELGFKVKESIITYCFDSL